MKGIFPLSQFSTLTTPFYYYDLSLLRATLKVVTDLSDAYGYHIHYAIKANANSRILSTIQQTGIGVDCVSGGEIQAALAAGFTSDKIVFAGVGKADWEIKLALSNDISCFNAESIAELEVINSIALDMNTKARVALRINPDVSAHTHANITTGLKENKFGIALEELDHIIEWLPTQSALEWTGLHFHIGSQIMEMDDYTKLCNRINEIQSSLWARHIIIPNINVGGGLGIDYHHPNKYPIPDFESYFTTFRKGLKLQNSQQLHFEPGRSIVGQCGSLITQVLYVKSGINKQFAIVDAGMTELIRPAMYHAYHHIENLSSNIDPIEYDVVGPICESSDVFAKSYSLNRVSRGDLIAIRSAGAYGEIMASQYNCRTLPKAYFSEDLL